MTQHTNCLLLLPNCRAKHKCVCGICISHYITVDFSTSYKIVNTDISGLMPNADTAFVLSTVVWVTAIGVIGTKRFTDLIMNN